MSLTDENLIELTHCPSHILGITGKRISVSTLYRWLKKGVAGVKLESVFVAGRRYTSGQAIRRFIQLSSAARSKAATLKALSRQRAQEQELEASNLGI